MSTILFTYGLPTDGIELLDGHKVIMPSPLTDFTADELNRLIPEADAVLVGSALSGEHIRMGKRLKIIANYGAGYDRVDIRAAAACGIPVTNLPTATIESTAEAALTLMLSAARRAGEMNLRLRQEKPESLFGMGRNMGMSLQGKTLGILGVGKIGSKMAYYGKMLGMRVIGYSRRGADPAAAEPVSLEELLRQSDVLSLHCPLNDTTRNLIGAAELNAMKEGAILVNTARGGVVDHAALLEALRSGHIRAAGLDVFPDEPHIPAGFAELPQVVMTPHIGTNTVDARRGMLEACCRQILDALAGRRPTPIVNGL